MPNISLVRYWRLFHIAQIGLFLFSRAAHGIKGGRSFSKRQVGFGRRAQGIAYFRVLDSLLG